MAFLFGDTHDHYATADVLKKYTQAGETIGGGGSFTIAAVGRNSSNGARCIAGGSGQRHSGPRITLAPSGATAIAQFAYRAVSTFSSLGQSTTETSSNTIGAFRLSGTTQVWLRANTNGTISAYRSTTLLGTTTIALQQNVYHYLELEVVINSSTGTVTLYIDGTQALALTGINTQGGASAAWDEFVTPSVGGTGAGQSVEINWDDLMLMDGSGSDYNGLVGDHQGLYVPADGEGAHTDGTPSTGADRAAMVDEASADGDTTYNTKDTTAQRDSFTLSTWPSSGTIGPVQLVGEARKEDAGAASIALGVRISTTDYDGADQGLSTSYAFYREVFELNPATSAAWAGGSAPQIVDEKAV